MLAPRKRSSSAMPLRLGGQGQKRPRQSIIRKPVGLGEVKPVKLRKSESSALIRATPDPIRSASSRAKRPRDPSEGPVREETSSPPKKLTEKRQRRSVTGGLKLATPRQKTWATPSTPMAGVTQSRNFVKEHPNPETAVIIPTRKLHETKRPGGSARERFRTAKEQREAAEQQRREDLFSSRIIRRENQKDKFRGRILHRAAPTTPVPPSTPRAGPLVPSKSVPAHLSLEATEAPIAKPSGEPPAERINPPPVFTKTTRSKAPFLGASTRQRGPAPIKPVESKSRSAAPSRTPLLSTPKEAPMQPPPQIAQANVPKKRMRRDDPAETTPTVRLDEPMISDPSVQTNVPKAVSTESTPVRVGENRAAQIQRNRTPTLMGGVGEGTAPVAQAPGTISSTTMIGAKAPQSVPPLAADVQPRRQPPDPLPVTPIPPVVVPKAPEPMETSDIAEEGKEEEKEEEPEEDEGPMEMEAEETPPPQVEDEPEEEEPMEEMVDDNEERKNEAMAQLPVKIRQHARDETGIDTWDSLLTRNNTLLSTYNELATVKNRRGQTLSHFIEKSPNLGIDPDIINNTTAFLKAMQQIFMNKKKNAEAAINLVEVKLQEVMTQLKTQAEDADVHYTEFNKVLDATEQQLLNSFDVALTDYSARIDIYRQNVQETEQQMRDYSDVLQRFYNIVIDADNDVVMRDVANDLEEENHKLERKVHELSMAQPNPDDTAKAMNASFKSKGGGAGGAGAAKRAMAGPGSVDPSIAASREATEAPGTRKSEHPQPQKHEVHKILAIPEPAGEGEYASSRQDGYAGPYEPNSKVYLSYYPLPYGTLEFWKSDRKGDGSERKRHVYYARLSGTENYQKIRKTDLPASHPLAPGEKVPRTKKNRFIEKWIKDTT